MLVRQKGSRFIVLIATSSVSNMEMSSAPDTRRRPHRVHLAPGGQRFGKRPLFFKRGVGSLDKKFSIRAGHPLGIYIALLTFWPTLVVPHQGSLNPTMRAPSSAIERPFAAVECYASSRRAVFVQTQKERIRVPFTVPKSASPIEFRCA
jgi:hypothetical protein